MFGPGTEDERVAALDKYILFGPGTEDERVAALDRYILFGPGTEEERVAALDKIAESCFLQGNYHLATKKWTQVCSNKIHISSTLFMIFAT